MSIHGLQATIVIFLSHFALVAFYALRTREVLHTRQAALQGSGNSVSEGWV